jgi:hypothetical protein
MKLKSGLRTATPMQDDQADPAMDPVEDPNLLVEGEGEPQDEDHNYEIIADEWEPEEAQDQFDDEEDATEDNTVTYQASMIRVTLDNIAATKVMAVCSKPAALNSMAEQMYHQRSKLLRLICKGLVGVSKIRMSKHSEL